MIRIRDLSLPPDGDMARLVQAAARQLRISPNEIKQLDLKKKSVDARKKNDVRINTPSAISVSLLLLNNN